MSRRSARLNNQKQHNKGPGQVPENESRPRSRLISNPMPITNIASGPQSSEQPKTMPQQDVQGKVKNIMDKKTQLKEVMPILHPFKHVSFEQMVEITLHDIQVLDYRQPVAQLKQKFKNLVKNYIVFDDIFPIGLNITGKQILKNGIFHEMWGKICKKCHKEHEFMHYYQKYEPQLIINHTNFENVFNQYSFSKEQTNCICLIDEEESMTRLTQTPKALSTSNNMKPKMEKPSEEQREKANDRLRIISVAQSNQTRVRSEMVCYFLGIKLVFHWVQLEQPTVLEFNHDEDKALIVIQAHVPIFNKQLQKKVVSLTPQTLVAMHGYVSFAELLRVKQQYEAITGFIIIEELASIKSLAS